LKYKNTIILAAIGFAAGAVNGLFGAGGGMILVPLLSKFGVFEEDEVFPASVSIILPICLVSLGVSLWNGPIIPAGTLWYLAGSAAGGLAVGFWGRKIPVQWLHRILGIFILWGGVRYLC